ncbi:MAG TPA: stage V sporulation protein AD [Ruminococcus sp.]|nr:stage V sporulation protein AD [Ruminococcus sp.]
MAELIAPGVFRFDGCIKAESYGTAVGETEGKGPLGDCFDVVEKDSHLGCDTWEQAESKLQLRAVDTALAKAGLRPEDIGVVCAGDLNNQCTASAYGLRGLGIPYLGLYGACSTMAEGILTAALMIESGAAERSAAATSSHFSTAERQFRSPLSYGGQRTPTAQRTCTAAGAVILSRKGKVSVAGGCIGKIADMGITDMTNMGSAMAPAAADTVERYLEATGTAPCDYDFIVTGDLGTVGSSLLAKLLEEKWSDLAERHRDCGVMIYAADSGDPFDSHCGGSGCGCGASVLCGHFLPMLESGEADNLLFIATGALMSPMMIQQGESIPSVAHLVHFRRS